MSIRLTGWLLSLASCSATLADAATKHSPASRFMSYESRVMCGYQGWFRAEGDGSGAGWQHYGGKNEFSPSKCVIDFWPDVSEYAQTYPTQFKLKDGSPARVFSPWDESTVEMHFRWMREYGIDGVFMQRFFGVTRTKASRAEGRVVLGHALKASQKEGRAVAVMYDLSGLNPGENCDSIIQDWKELVDTLKITSQGANQTYLYHRGKPLVVIWGIGFPDRPYDIRKIGFEKLLDFLKYDRQYGGCSIMLGVPTYFRDLRADTISDPYLHQILAKADVIMPWMVGRFSASLCGEMSRYSAEVRADLDWCKERKLDYAPCVYPGFSWHNLRKGKALSDAIPRQRGEFYWSLMTAAIQSGAKMIYVAMFDEVNEGTAILKCTNEPPTDQPPAKFLTYEGLPTDHYLWLTGQAGRMLRHDMPLDPELYLNVTHQFQSISKTTSK